VGVLTPRDDELWPCLGLCSTTNLGDLVCIGCKRKRQDVIDWNKYSDDKKRIIMRGIRCEN